MIDFLKNRWVLFVVLILFIAFKIPHLFYPYYWDECWPYMTAITELHKHGASLMPGALDPELSRGHPLLFHSMASVWMGIFGSSHLAMHSFALLISLSCLVFIYEAALRMFNQRVAILSLLLVATQVVFFVQSSFVLFEVLIAFLALVGLYSYARDKYVLTALTLSALFYTKESGLILGFVLGLDALAGLLNKKLPLHTRLYRFLSVAVPCLLIAFYFIMQRYRCGWFMFPFYAGSMEHTWNGFWYKLRMGCIHVAMYDDLKFYYFLLLAALSIVAAVRTRKPAYAITLLPVIIIYYFVNDMRAGRPMPSVPFFILFVAICCWFLYVLSRKNMFADARQGRFIVLSGLFILCFLCFSALNFFTYRYLLAVIIPLFVMAAALMDLFIQRSYKWLFYPTLTLILFISFCSFRYNKGHGDVDLGAFEGMALQQDVIDYMEQNAYYDKVICTYSFLEREHLTDPSTGFLRSAKTFKHVSYEPTNNTEIQIFDNLEYDNRYEEVKKDTTYTTIFRKDRHDIWAEVFKKKSR